MAQNYKYSRVQYDTFTINGDLSSNGSTIAYVDGQGTNQTITVTNCFNKFKGQPITLTISTKADVDLTSQFESN